MVVAGKKITNYHRTGLNWKKEVKSHPFRFQLRNKGWKEAA
jgi:hypothetical protein